MLLSHLPTCYKQLEDKRMTVEMLAKDPITPVLDELPAANSATNIILNFDLNTPMIHEAI